MSLSHLCMQKIILRVQRLELPVKVRKDRRWEENRTTKDEMVGSHYQLDGHEFEYALGVGDGQGSLAFWSPWSRKESDMTE